MKSKKISTDKAQIDEILSRGVSEVIDKKNLEEKLLLGGELRVKLGIDPTSPNIHLGRAVVLLKLRDFQELGHKIIFLIGDFTGTIGDTSDKDSERPMLSAGQVRDLDAAGVDIGSHGHRHVALDEIPFAEAVREIETSRDTLEEIVGHRVVTFAYPYGYHTGRIKRYLETTGFESACAVKQAISHPNDDRFALARAIVNSDITIEGLD